MMIRRGLAVFGKLTSPVNRAERRVPALGRDTGVPASCQLMAGSVIVGSDSSIRTVTSFSLSGPVTRTETRSLPDLLTTTVRWADVIEHQDGGSFAIIKHSGYQLIDGEEDAPTVDSIEDFYPPTEL